MWQMKVELSQYDSNIYNVWTGDARTNAEHV